MIIARTANVEAARLLIERGADVNAVEQYRGQTALIWAAAQRQPAMVQELVKRGAKVDARSAVNNWERQVTAEPRAVYRPVGGLTALHFAAREGCAECARYLAEGGADLNLPDPEGVTPLITAITNGHFDTAKYLIEKGANVNKFDVYGRTPLYEAVDQNTLPHGGRPDWPSVDKTTGLQIMELLLKSGAYPDPELKLAQPYRFVATDRGRDGMLLTGTTPLLRAAKGMDAPAIKLLLAAGAQIDLGNSRDFFPIIAAAGVGSGENDTRGWFNTPDVQQRSIAALKLLLDAGANIETKGGQRSQPALHGAASWGWNEVVQFLVDRGANINSKDARGLTALDAAMGRASGNGRGQTPEPHMDTAKLIEKLGGVAGTPAPAPAAGGRGGR
jgi:ankyrin repeat protein